MRGRASHPFLALLLARQRPLRPLSVGEMASIPMPSTIPFGVAAEINARRIESQGMSETPPRIYRGGESP